MLDSGASAILADLYAGTRERARWDRAMERIADRLDAAWMMVAGFDFDARTPVAPDFYHVRTPSFDAGIAEYAEHTVRLDPTNRFVAANPRGGVYDSARDFRPGDEEYHRWNADRLGSARWRLHHGGPDGMRIGVSLHRTAGRGPLDERDGQLFGLLFDHVREAAALALRPPLLDGPEPLLLLDHRAVPIAASPTGRALLERSGALRIEDGRIRAAHRDCGVAFDAAIAACLAGAASRVAALRRPDAPPLYARISALPRDDAPLPALRARLLVRLVDPAAVPSDRRADWRALFGLTPAEARLADALLAGDGNLRHAAEAMGIAYATARAQAAGLFDKVGVRSQVQLVRLLARLG